MLSAGSLPLIVWLTATLGAPASAAAPDTWVHVSLDQTVTTRTARVGDVVHLHTVDDVTIDGRRVLRGAAVTGTVVRAKRAGRIHGRAELAIGDLTILGPEGGALAVAHGTLTALPPSRTPRGFYARQSDAEGPILTAMAAGYGGAWLASRWSHSEETVAGAGALTGLAALALVKILPREEDLQLSPGGAIRIAFTACGAQPHPSLQPSHESTGSRSRRRSS